MKENIVKRDKLLNAINHLAVVLLSAPREETFIETLTKGMELIGSCLEADCVQVWPNEEKGDVLHFVLQYKWLSKDGHLITPTAIGTAVPYSKRWMDVFLKKEAVNGPISELPKEDQQLLGPLGLLSTCIIPLFYQDKFWGVLSVDDCTKERYFCEDEIKILHSVGLMIVSAIERNEQAAKVQEAQKRTQLLLDKTPLAAHLWDRDYHLFDCNEEALRLFKAPDKQEYLGQFYERSPEFQPNGKKTLDMARIYLDTAFETGYCNFTWLYQTLEGEVWPAEINLVRVEYGDDYAVAGYSRDLREQNRMMRELEAAQFTTSAMLEANPQVNILFDDDFRVIDCNPAAVSFMGFESKDDMIARFLERITSRMPEFQPDGAKTVPLMDRLSTAAKEGHVEYETVIDIGDGKKHLSVSLKRIPYEGNFAIVAYLSDMTEAKAILHKTERLMAEAEAANKAKSTFLSTMSHEIRTPMNAILGITEIQLLSDSLSPDMREAFEKIYTSGDLLLGIINDILDLSRIEADKLELVSERYELASLVSDTAQINMMRIGSKAIEFELYVDEDVPTHLIGDELRVKQILNNLLSNAFKYTMEGMVRLAVWVEPIPHNHDEMMLVVSVSDTGQGMNKEQVNRLFEEYTRFNVDTNPTTEGTGLGMSIARNLILMMRGEITIDSELSKGSTFTVFLPQGNAGAERMGKELSENLQQFRTSSRARMKRVQMSREPMPYGSILVVDDVESNIYVAMGLLSPYGLQIDTAESGMEAIEKVRAGKTYDIIFMDHMMPVMDGMEAVGCLRDMGYDSAIVALTANTVAGQAEVFLANGFDEFISKPIDIRLLNSLLNKLIRDKQPPEVIEAARRQAEEAGASLPQACAQQAIDPRIVEVFVRDAQKTIKALEELCKKGDYEDEGNLRNYVIYTHGIKSALANIGEMGLSAIALKLETAGRGGKVELLRLETPSFLKALKDAVEVFLANTVTEDCKAENEDREYLLGQLRVIQTACEVYDKASAKRALDELKKSAWSKSTKEQLGTISQSLLRSDFEEIVDYISKILAS
ncbi:MAG: ATP-binding protein [Coriobacteriia bacterium]|nr:ATP-binding protein [Coriobacteriia bacterium]